MDGRVAFLPRSLSALLLGGCFRAAASRPVLQFGPAIVPGSSHLEWEDYSGQSATLMLWEWKEEWNKPPCPTTRGGSRLNFFYKVCGPFSACFLVRQQNYTFWIQTPTSPPLLEGHLPRDQHLHAFDVNISSLPCLRPGQAALASCVKSFVSEPQLIVTNKRNFTRRFVTVQVDLKGGWLPMVQLRYDVRIGAQKFHFDATNFSDAVARRKNSFHSNLNVQSNPCTLHVGA